MLQTQMLFHGYHHYNNNQPMIKKLISVAYLAIMAVSICSAQSNISKTITDWGESVHKVHLSIALSNNIIDIGSTMTLSAKIENASTNVIRLIETGPLTDFVIVITNGSGNVYKLSPDNTRRPTYYRLTISLQPGEIRDWSLLATIGKDIEPGDYILKASKSFSSIGGDGGELVSNLLKVQIK
jgi:hypothetical protein